MSGIGSRVGAIVPFYEVIVYHFLKRSLVEIV